MTKSLPFALLSGAALLCGTTAIAQMKPAAKTVAKTTTTKTTKTVKKPAAAPKRVVSRGRMVTTKTSNGKSITYDCSKAGNAAKQACKKR